MTALQQVLAWISGSGPWAPVLFILVYVAACVLFIPGSILTLGAGLVFGVIKGTIIVSIASTLGATAAFLIGRYLARDWISGKISGDARFAAIDGAVERGGWLVVGLLRLSPIFPFNLLNYACGLTRVSLRDYVLASWIGMLPGTAMYVYIGSLAGDLSGLGRGGRSRTPLEWALYSIGLLATIFATVYITRHARKAIGQKLAVQEDGKRRKETMKKIAVIVAASLMTTALSAAEHPKEHPTGAPAQMQEQAKPAEHPKGHEHPVGSKQWTQQMNKEFTKVVESDVAQKTASEGAFKINDEKLGKEWSLALIGVHKKRVVYLGDQHFFACADFQTVGKGKKDKLDLDFYATKTDGGWQVDKVLIHKVNGRPRYTYNDRNEMVPASS